MTRENQDRQEFVESMDVRKETVENDGADKLRKKHRKKYDGSEPLKHPGHEALALHLATPKPLRKFRTDSDLAKHFRVTRMTVYRWKQSSDVVRRAYCLSDLNQMSGDLPPRQAWPQIMAKVVKNALKGDMESIVFCEARAWRNQLQVQESSLSASAFIEDLLGTGKSNEPEELQNSNLKTEGSTR